MVRPIPQPDGKLPVIGHARQINLNSPIRSLAKIAHKVGPIYRLEFAGGAGLIVVSGQEIVHELCDESRFDKKVSGALRNIRDIAYDGLFTAHTREPNWHKAHNVLLPGFNVSAMADYYPMMLTVARELIEKWERTQGRPIDVADDMVRLTLDTIGLCGFDYRFDSFHRDTQHPFIRSMLIALQEASDRAIRLPLLTALNRPRQREYERSASHLKQVVDEVIRERKSQRDASGTDEDRKDLLSLMLERPDSKTGELLSDENMRYQIITFLIAGHETTSGLLSFALYALLKHPAVLDRATAEVDRVLGPGSLQSPTLDQIKRLTYVRQILNEALRLWPPAPAFTVNPLHDDIIGGEFAVKAREAILVLVPELHRDRTAWGVNAELFDPENFNADAMRDRPPNSFKPFGNGQRACIGSQFALQEATLVLAMILQRFELLDHTNYQLRIQETLTIKPGKFTMKVRARTPVADVAPAAAVSVPSPASDAPLAFADHATPLLVLYGSNMGSAEQIANRIGEEAEAQGYTPLVQTLDERVGDLPSDGVVLIVSASYNGMPPDNAVGFVEWLQNACPELSGVRYAVFGVGNRDWANTYQRVPALIDETLAQAGAERLLARGEADARGDFFGDVDAWLHGLWGGLAEQLGLSVRTAEQGPRYEVETIGRVTPLQTVADHFDLVPMTVRRNAELVDTTHDDGRSKRHLTVELPPGTRYKTGDHLLVMPRNPPELVSRVLARLRLAPDQLIVVRKNYGNAEHLPLQRPVRAADLLEHFVELQEPATARQVAQLAERASGGESARLTELAEDPAYRTEVLEPRCSLIDLALQYPSVNLHLDWLLEHWPAAHPRYYSVASSDRLQDDAVDLIVSVIAEEAWSGLGHLYYGACSSMLAKVREGERIFARLRDVTSDFLPPDDPRTPIIMIAAGSGLAPFRGFIQDRLIAKERDTALGPAMLFFGCRHPDVDYLFAEELHEAQRIGVVDVVPAFSRARAAQYVQDALLEHRGIVAELLAAGAIVYVCGDGKAMVPAVRGALETVVQESPDAADSLAELENASRLRIDAWF